ncbi:unnamed protein product, partial [Didymodactylos carnosus]
NRNLYNSLNSSTYRTNGKYFRIDYADRDYANGIYVSDTVTIGSLSIEKQLFGQADDARFLKTDKYDGLLGLSCSTPDIRLSLCHNMWKQNLIEKPIFSFYFNANYTAEDDNEFIFGGIDQTKYEGTITWVNIIHGQKDWEFLMDSINIGDKKHKRLGFAKSTSYDQKQTCFDSLYNDDSTATTTEDDSYPLDDEYVNDARSTTEMYNDDGYNVNIQIERLDNKKTERYSIESFERPLEKTMRILREFLTARKLCFGKLFFL